MKFPFVLLGIVLLACETLTAEVKIRGAHFGNWFVTDEMVTFSTSGELADDCLVDVTVFAADGRTIFRDRIAGRNFKKTGWQRPFKTPGYYEAEFAVDGKPLTESFTAVVKRPDPKNRAVMREAAKQEFAIARHGFVVAAHPTRPASEISPVFGASPHMEFYQKALPLAKLVGFHSIRVHHVPWGIVEPERGRYDWSYPDDFMKVAHENGFANSNIIINTFNTPRWASPHPEEDWFDNCITVWGCYAPKDLNDWKNYLRRMMERYPDLQAVELGNEPNLPGFSCFWHDTPENFYLQQKVGYDAIKAVAPKTSVWLGGGPGLAFYEKLLRLGGGTYFDVLPVHGSLPEPGEYWAIEKKLRMAAKPVVNSEWHAGLLAPGDKVFPSDRELARRMLLHFLTQVKIGIREIYLFSIMNIWNSERESLQFYLNNNIMAIHVSGLFRRAPYAEPRYLAASWHTFTDLIRGPIRVGDGYRFADGMAQKAQLLESDAGPLLIVWNEAAIPMSPHPALLRAAAGGTVLRADGSPVENFAGEKLAVDIYYIVKTPDLAVIRRWTNRDDLLKMTDPRAQLDKKWRTGYVCRPLFDARLNGPEKAEWTRVSTPVKCDSKAQCGPLAVRFAVGIADGKLDLIVRVNDAVHWPDPTGRAPWNGDSLQFAVDTRNRGIETDQVEFIALREKSGRAVLRKVAAPAIGGDLPTRYTMPGKLPGAEVANAECRIDRKGNETTYRIRLDMVELYPLVFQTGDEVRFSLLVNNNDGRGRAAWWEWSSGIGQAKEPRLYGTLVPATGKSVIFQQSDLVIKGWAGDFELKNSTATIRIETRQSQAAGFGTWPKPVVPGGSYRVCFSACGNIRLQVLATGKTLPRLDVVPPLQLEPRWKSYEYTMRIPNSASDCAISFLAWDQKNCWYEIKDFSVIGL